MSYGCVGCARALWEGAGSRHVLPHEANPRHAQQGRWAERSIPARQDGTSRPGLVQHEADPKRRPNTGWCSSSRRLTPAPHLARPLAWHPRYPPMSVPGGACAVDGAHSWRRQ